MTVEKWKWKNTKVDQTHNWMTTIYVQSVYNFESLPNHIKAYGPTLFCLFHFIVSIYFDKKCLI